jgi:tetratricopeptide (TPR) repeat protein
MKHISELKDYLSAMILLGWIAWKQEEKVCAQKIWAAAYDSDFISEIDRVSAMCGLAIYHSELKSERGAGRASELIEEIISILEDMDELSLDVSVRLNSVGIALANVKQFEKAEKIILQAMSINESIEQAGDARRMFEAIHQRAKNGYNLSSLILMKIGRHDEALTELTEEVVPRYETVKAETDLAAAYHRISEIYLVKANQKETYEEKTDDLQKAYDFEYMSSLLWEKHLEDQPGRYTQATDNLKKIRTIVEENEKHKDRE